MKLVLFIIFFSIAGSLTAATQKCVFGNTGCGGSCGIKNSKCATIQQQDMLFCGCTYCNYNSTIKKCAGICKNTDLIKCINRVPIPKADADCGCASCKKTVDKKGKISCSGDCFNSGLKCSVKRLPAFNPNGYSDECICK